MIERWAARCAPGSLRLATGSLCPVAGAAGDGMTGRRGLLRGLLRVIAYCVFDCTRHCVSYCARWQTVEEAIAAVGGAGEGVLRVVAYLIASLWADGGGGEWTT